MNWRPWSCGVLLSLIAGFALIAGGCNRTENKRGQAKNKGATNMDMPAEFADATKDNKKGDDHSGWWCAEHGVPEEVCGQCNAKLAAEFKKKGDWCKEHERPESQCFICHPEKKEQFTAQYRAKYGNAPPPIEEESKKDEPKNKNTRICVTGH